ncbi:hypothetical protein LEP1GSC070_2098 [Leptospira santarosai str. AIM]|nr:hypothetical protein LEP1GSC070_2098 [Leptospira santarosai str. AIM]
MVRTSAVEEPKTDWLEPPPKSPPPLPVWIITSKTRKRETKTKRVRMTPFNISVPEKKLNPVPNYEPQKA